MARKMIVFIIILSLAITPTTIVYAGNAVVLTDQELDQVYAGGLNLNFDGFLGNMDSVTGSVSGGVSGTTAVSDSSIIVNPAEQLAMLSPSTVKSPAAPSQVVAPAIPATPATPTQPTAPIAPEVPTSPVSPTVPNVPKAVESFIANNGKIGVVAFESLGNIDAVELNTINVTDTAQQYLSAMNNVNAAGSTVLIQQNLVILINSTVGNLNNLNDLNLQDYVPNI